MSKSLPVKELREFQKAGVTYAKTQEWESPTELNDLAKVVEWVHYKDGPRA